MSAELFRSAKRNRSVIRPVGKRGKITKTRGRALNRKRPAHRDWLIGILIHELRLSEACADGRLSAKSG
jgi:hypothetical protein